jgi:ABC-type molybdate transport system ATPase subunit
MFAPLTQQNADDATGISACTGIDGLPGAGNLSIQGKTKRPERYRDMLPCKRKIGYIAPDAALISNLTLRQNILDSPVLL